MRFRARRERAAPAELGTPREHHVEDHTDARDRLAREGAAGLVGVDDAGRVGERVGRKVVVGHERCDPERARA
jgi:hypothetical protein